MLKKKRRVEITAFRRRLVVVAAGLRTAAGDFVVEIRDPDAPEAVEIGPVEQREILVETIRLLEETIRVNASSGQRSADGRRLESEEPDK